MSFGFPPNYTQTFSYPGATKFLLHKVTLSTFQEMDWSIIDKSQSLVTARSPFSLFSWGETISVKLDKNSITVASSSRGLQIYDFGKNKSNVSDFGTTFERLAKDASIDVPRQSLRPVRTLESIGEEYTPDDLSIENTETSPSFNSLFIPRKNYFVTPIIAIINILVFAVMVITGAGIVSPKIEIILSWGANFRPLTLQGEWWRLFTSCFVHIGIEHLLMNLYALLFIGLLLEPIMGSVRFSFAYILAGLTGSIASLYWHEVTVSAGASGAIFGLYGVFLSLLTTKYIEEKKRKSLLLSIIIFVVYNLVFGLKGNIDNAAHIGGLLGGLFIGYCYYFSLKKPKDKRLNAATISLSVIVLVSTSFFVFANT
jgi:rhomboid protease GluP